MLNLYRNNRSNDPDDTSFLVGRNRLVEGDHGRWRMQTPRRLLLSAEGLHVFVVIEGVLYLSKVRLLAECGVVRHINLSGGDPVEFAGEIRFRSKRPGRGRLLYWNDKTGHYNDPARPMDPLIVPQLPIKDFQRFKPSWRGPKL